MWRTQGRIPATRGLVTSSHVRNAGIAARLPTRDFREGSIVKGRILEVRPREVLVDIGYKTEGAIPTSEFDDVEDLQVGDEVEVLLVRLENDEGMVILSKETRRLQPELGEDRQGLPGAAASSKARSRPSSKAASSSTSASRRSCPARRSTSSRRRISTQFVGNTYDFKIVKINDDRKNVVLSRRELIEAGARREAPALPRHASRSATRSRAWSRTSPTSARSSTSTAWTACCTSPT